MYIYIKRERERERERERTNQGAWIFLTFYVLISDSSKIVYLEEIHKRKAELDYMKVVRFSILTESKWVHIHQTLKGRSILETITWKSPIKISILLSF